MNFSVFTYTISLNIQRFPYVSSLWIKSEINFQYERSLNYVKDKRWLLCIVSSFKYTVVNSYPDGLPSRKSKKTTKKTPTLVPIGVSSNLRTPILFLTSETGRTVWPCLGNFSCNLYLRVIYEQPSQLKILESFLQTAFYTVSFHGSERGHNRFYLKGTTHI